MQNLYSVHDSKAEVYERPFVMRNKAEAIRAMETTTKDTTTKFNKFPTDFTLVELGEWDDVTGSIVCHEKPIIIANCSEFLQ